MCSIPEGICVFSTRAFRADAVAPPQSGRQQHARRFVCIRFDEGDELLHRRLDLPLRSFWVDIRRGRPQIDCGNIEGQYKLFELDFPADPEYRLAVCVRDLSESEPRLMVL